MRRTTTFAIGLLLYAVAIPVHAATITVTNTNDSGPGSLRQALADASDGDTIDFAVTGIIGLTSSELVIDKSITISGPGPNLLTVSASGLQSGSVFHVTTGSTVEIEGLMISDALRGSGILNDQATLVVTDCVITNNQSVNGGGIYNVSSATLTVLNSTIDTNCACAVGGGVGGGISNGKAVLTIVNSTVSNNFALDAHAPGLGQGGGIDSEGPLTISNSTISRNFAGYVGGGIDGTGTITDSTISENTAGGPPNPQNAPGFGGGIAGGGTIINSTITGNTAWGDDFKGPGVGGGIAGGATLMLTNDTLSNNSATVGGGISTDGGEIGNTILNNNSNFNIDGTINSHGYNLSSDDGGGNLTGPGDQINTDPLLGPLQNNGGPTQTHALLPSSPAIDTGDPSFTPPPFYDQRGPDFYRLRNNRVDIGSFEVQEGPAVTPPPTPTPTATATATPTAAPTATPTPSTTPRATPTPRIAPTPRSRPTPRPRP